MKRVYFATRIRGFFHHLFTNPNLRYKFLSSDAQFYEVNGWKRSILSKISKLKIFDTLGLIQVITTKGKNCDIYGSSNRFLNTDKPYFIYLENPTALYHYQLSRGKSKIGKSKLGYLLKNDNLKAIICMSNACLSTFEELCGDYGGKKKLIYPYIPTNKKVSNEIIHSRCFKDEFNLLFIAQGNAFISKGALEIIEAFKRTRERKGENIHLTMVTSINEVDSLLIQEIKTIEGITLIDFNLNFEQMENLYVNSTLLLHPTSHDSFALVVLEAMKAGLPVIATKLYAIPEMVKEGENGFLTDPKYWFFDKNNIPNPSVWNNRENTIFSNKISEELVEFLIEKISILYTNRELLEQMSIKSLNTANSAPFDEVTVTSQWNEVLAYLEGKHNK